MAKVIMYVSNTCTPCANMKPIFDEVVKEVGATDVEIRNIGDEGVREMALESGVRGVPTFVVQMSDGGNFSLTGTLTKEVLKSFISNAVNND